MKRAIFVLAAVCAAFVIGCGDSSAPVQQPSSPAGEQQKPMGMGKAVSNSPEMKLMGMKTAKDKAEYLKKLGSDPSFDPKIHKPMLETYAKDKEAAVAEAAKELLDKAN